MRRTCERVRVTALTVLLGSAFALFACSDSSTVAPAATSTAAAPAAAAARATSAAPAASPDAAAPPAAALAGRSGELVNPDENTVVFLYYDLAGIAPPIERWVEDDGRVKYGPALEKPALREAVRAELQAGAASVREVGSLRLSTNAHLSEYDPSNGEFIVRALAPSMSFQFAALGQKIAVQHTNGLSAQLWKVTPEEAQAVRDKLPFGTNVSLDVLLRITGVLPAPGGGTITTEVVEYELREDRGGATLARVQVSR